MESAEAAPVEATEAESAAEVKAELVAEADVTPPQLRGSQRPLASSTLTEAQASTCPCSLLKGVHRAQ
eukprot:6182769-Pleurochrysis_carterae.AAC.4